MLKAASGLPLFTGGGDLRITTQVVPATSGYDVVYHISNLTAVNQPLPTLNIYGLQLESQVDYLDLSFGTVFKPLQWTPANAAITEQNPYPTTRFAPVSIIRDRRIAVGVSIKYPVLNYKHAVSPQFRRYSNMTDNWMTFVSMMGASVAPGESRTYTVTTRFARPADWIHSLAPYRDYLWLQFGDHAHYSQDLRPIKGRTESVSELINLDTNPRGFIPYHWDDGVVSRTDSHGWRRTVDRILDILHTGGFRRFVLWTPSGLYSDPSHYPVTNGEPQFPSRIMTDWSPAMLASQQELQRITAEGIELGYWWGDSAMVEYEWNPAEVYPLDINNPSHVAMLDEQLYLANERGATWIGLDSYRRLDLWNAVPWLARMQSQFPNLRFSAEPNCSDILLFLIPFTTDSRNLPAAPLLADYLVPGREISVVFNTNRETMANAIHYTGWGSTIISFTSNISATQLEPYIQQARNGWVGDPFTPPPD